MRKRQLLAILVAILSFLFTFFSLLLKLGYFYIQYKQFSKTHRQRFRNKLRKQGLSKEKIDELCQLADISFDAMLAQMFHMIHKAST